MTTSQKESSWGKIKLSNVVNFIIDNRGRNPEYYTEKGIPVIDNFMITGEKFLRLENTKRYIDESIYKSFIRKEIIEDDVLVTLVGNGFGNIACAPKEKAVIIQNTIGLRASQDYSQSFLFYSLRFEKNNITALDRGAAQPSVKVGDLMNVEVFNPPLRTQNKIAVVIASYDNLIENNNKRIKILESIVQKLYIEWFVKNKTTNDYLKASIDNVAVVHRGKSYSSEDIKDVEGIPFVNLKCVNRYGGFRYDGLKAFSGDYKDSHVVKNGDIVMAVTDMTQERMIVARVARIPSLDGGFGVISMDLVKIEPKENTNKSWLYCFLRYSGLGDKLKNSANGANVLHLNPSRISEYELSVPPFDVQESFANLVEKMLLLQERLLVENRNLQSARDLLIPQLISGKIEIK